MKTDSNRKRAIAAGAVSMAIALGIAGCSASTDGAAGGSEGATQDEAAEIDLSQVNDSPAEDTADPADGADAGKEETQADGEATEQEDAAEAGESADELRADLNITEDYRDSFVHGEKPAEFQKYIVLHDTEGDGDASGVVDYWDGNGAGVAAHFIVNKDGSIVQCVPLDKITHHAGFGDAGHNALYGVEDESRDDKVGTTPIGDWAPDYGMNSYSIGIEMVHVGGEGDYPEEQLDAVDGLIAYIDAYYGSESSIIDHKAWRTGNSDTSAEFAGYLANYQDHRTHD